MPWASITKIVGQPLTCHWRAMSLSVLPAHQDRQLMLCLATAARTMSRSASLLTPSKAKGRLLYFVTSDRS